MELRGELTTRDAYTAFDQMLALRVAWNMRLNVTLVDALYVVIARRLDVALVTGDVRLAQAPELGVRVLTS